MLIYAYFCQFALRRAGFEPIERKIFGTIPNPSSRWISSKVCRASGSVTVAGSITAAFVQAIYLEENAQRQHLALQIGTPQPLDADECAHIGRNLSRPALLQKAWDYYAAKHLPAGWP